MRLPLLTAGAALLLCTTAAIAQNSPSTSATVSPPTSKSAIEKTSTPLRDNIQHMLQQYGFSDIRVAPTAFMIRAKDQQGNPVVMNVSPDSVTEVSELGTSGSNGNNSAGTSSQDGSGRKFVDIEQNEKLSSNLVGLDVYNMSNQDIGQIKDIALGPAGHARAYVVSVGGFLGMGTHYVALDPSAIQVTYNNTDQKWHAKTGVTSDELKSASAFQYNGRWNASKS